jgi:signal transduction histidine kinase
MADLSSKRLLSFARRIQHAADFSELIEEAHREVSDAVGYVHCWFMVADDDNLDELRLIDYSGTRRATVWEVSPKLQVKGDRFLEELIASDLPVVIEDARTDPRTDKRIVEQLQNRTLINIPLRLLDRPFGVFGVGTFGDEGCRAPTEAELDYLSGMAGQLAVAGGRIRFLEQKVLAELAKRDFERRLIQMQRLESLGLLAGGIAHDFNNLLTVIMSCASLAQQYTREPPVKSELEAVLGAASRARDLTMQLLAMSRTQELRLMPIDVNARIAEMHGLMRRVFPENIEIDLIPAHNLPFVEGDASQLDQVFMNLCINARDAMPNGGRLTIETEQVLLNGNFAATHPWAKPGRYVLITVTDNGIGMTVEIAERVFEPFFTTKEPHTGTGLGLAVAHGIVSQHGGMLHCYSEAGHGAAFKLYLPVLARLASQVGSKIKSPPPRGHGRILLAEDDEAVRAVARRILEGAGYTVTTVENGKDACAVAAAQEFDLVILDVMMPGLPCHDVVVRLRTEQPQLRLLLASGYSAATNVAELTRIHALTMLRKPYDPDEMLRHVRDALDN